MKFSGKVGNRPMNKWLNFGGDPDTDNMDPDPYFDTMSNWQKYAVHRPSASN